MTDQKEVVLVCKRENITLRRTKTMLYQAGSETDEVQLVPFQEMLSFDFCGYSRPECEKAYDFTQLIPYVILHKGKIGHDDCTYVSYLRGKKGAESKLHDKYSIGVGGHISVNGHIVVNDSSHAKYLPKSVNIQTILFNEVIKEIQEEVGIHLLEYYGVEKINEKINNSVMFYIDKGMDSVNSYHAAVPIFIDITEFADKVKSNEPGVIEKLTFLNKRELNQLSSNSRLETWSDIVLKSFL